MGGGEKDWGLRFIFEAKRLPYLSLIMRGSSALLSAGLAGDRGRLTSCACSARMVCDMAALSC